MGQGASKFFSDLFSSPQQPHASSARSREDDDVLLKDIDFSCGHEPFPSQVSDRYSPVIPANASGAEQPLSLEPTFSTSSLPHAHVLHVLQERYEPSPADLSRREGFGERIISLPIVVRNIEKNVCALSKGNGLVFASAVLIASDLILTARHCIENVDVRCLNLRVGYQLTLDGISYGVSVSVAHVLEENAELDYAILQLSSPVTDFSKINFCYKGTPTGSTALIHHPNGGPKLVSVHATVQSAQKSVAYSGFHDSSKGSSGAGYFDAQGQLFALHIGYPGSTTFARFISDIFRNSYTLQMLVYRRSQLPPQEPQSLLESTLSSQNYWREVKLETNFLHLPALDNLGEFRQARHHIIPDTDMQSLWLMGQECGKLKALLLRLCYKCDPVEGNRTPNAIEWAPWNIFIGPDKAHRSDDPGNNLEKTRPKSFNETLWNQLKKLYPVIKCCQESRYTLDKELHGLEISQQEYAAKMAQQTADYDSQERMNPEDDLMRPAQVEPQGIKQAKNAYATALNKLFRILKGIDQFYPIKAYNHMHQTNLTDWSPPRHNKTSIINVDHQLTQNLRP